MTLEFSTKAGTLALLQGKLNSAQIAPLVYFNLSIWKSDPVSCVTKIQSELGGGPWIVRSSSLFEDSLNGSNAGKFLSIQNVNISELVATINKVAASYGKFNSLNEVLIQPMLQNVVRSGVAFSHDPNTCAPYRIINWSDGENTTAITGGISGHTWQQAAKSSVTPPKKIQSVLILLDEILGLFKSTPVDCEFAITDDRLDKMIWLLQVRPIILQHKPETEEIQAERLQCIEEKINRGMFSHPYVMGQRTVYGVMPDWNPAEIIGIRPKPLALSLYRELVTDSIWAYQRHNYGYRNLRSFPLMLHFFGLPYIDIRLSFNSFIPADLDEGLSGRLVDHYINRLLSKPTLHDKIEFEVVYSCYTLDLPERLEHLREYSFSRKECATIADSLRRLTNGIVHPQDGLWRKDAKKLKTLNNRREKLQASNLDPLERIYWLLEDIKRYGTLPFAGLARAGFVAIQMLKSLVSVGVLSQVDYDAFISSVSTVSGQLARDKVTLDKRSFLSQYGHLRPGTYDILSPRYDESPEIYFDWHNQPSIPDPVKPFSLTLIQMRELARLLGSHGLDPDPVGLFDFLQAGIEYREFAKFHFTRNLSDAFVLIIEYGKKIGITREELAFCDISVFKELHVAAAKPSEILLNSIKLGKARYKESLSVSLPPLISEASDVWAFKLSEADPNFITQKQIIAPVASCDNRDLIEGAVVCIPNADPGYDWLFSYPIAGLITAWGGVNSHMAIRAGELGLPSVIGAGEMLYRQWSVAKRLSIDCAGRTVKVIG